MTTEAAVETHPTIALRSRQNEIERQYKPVPVMNGSQQSGAIRKLTDNFIKLAQMVEELCDEGPSKRQAQELLHQAKLLGVHSISHRKG